MKFEQIGTTSFTLGWS